MKLLLKILGWIIGIIIVLFVCGYIWIRGVWTEKVAEEGLYKLVESIQSYEPLPQNFTKTVEKVYPNIFSNGAWGHFFDCAILGKR